MPNWNIEWYSDKQDIKGKKFRVVLLHRASGGVTEKAEYYFKTKRSADKWIKLAKLEKKNQLYTTNYFS